MTFREVLAQVIDWLQQDKRVSYRALKREFDIDDDYVEDLKEELIYSQKLAVDEDGRVLVWTGEKGEVPEPASRPAHPEPQPVVEQAQPIQEVSPPVEPHTPDAERRQLTVMFCDLVGSTSLSGELDPEDLRDIVKAYQAACTGVIQRYDGHIAQHLGDGLLVYFGYPQAHEDDPQRAVYTGLGIIESLKNLNERLKADRGIQLSVRVGIHTGLVVIGEIGSGSSQERLALGETPNLAARIQGVAEPATVVISADTYRLVQGFFDCDALGEHDLRGVSQPIVVYRVLHESGAQSRLDIASTRGLTPLVGREQETGLLLDRWGQVTEGQGQVVLLSGEAGIGKSRLVQALKDHVADEPHAQEECRCSPYYTNSAFYPLADFLQRKLGWYPNDDADEKLHKLETVLTQTHLDVNTAVPLFTALLSLPLPDNRYPSLTLSSQQQRQQTLQAFLQLVLLAAEQHPVLLIVEDLHWVDPSTLEFLALLIDQTPTASIFVLLTCRPEFQPTWSHRSYLTEVSLSRLSRHQVEQLATQVASGKALPADVIEQLVDKTDGVPLYVEEMTKSVLESSVLKQVDGRYELTGSLSALSIPSTLQDSLMSRLDRLMTAKVIAQLGATIGRQFDYGLLHAVSELDEPTLKRELGRLVDAELIYQRGLPPHATYIFKHALVQDTAYESLLRSTRQQYHQRIANVLTSQFGDIGQTSPELLAHHYTEAGLDEQALDYWQQAGQRAIERSANAEAISHFDKGLALFKTLPETPERVQQELNMQMTLGSALMAAKGYAAKEVEPIFQRARELYQQVGETPQSFRVLRGLWVFYQVRAEYQVARQLGEQLFALAQRQQDPASLLSAHLSLGNTLYQLGVFGSARTHLEQGIALYDPTKRRSQRALQDPGVACLCMVARTLWVQGYADSARQRNQEALVLAQSLSHPYSLAFVVETDVNLAQFRLEAHAAQEPAEALIALGTEHDFPWFVATATIFRGWVLAQQGQSEAGIAQLHQGIAMFRTTGALALPHWLALLAEAYGRGRQTEEGLAVLAESLALVDETREAYYEAELHRLKGQLLLQQSSDNTTNAESCFQQAISIAQNQSAKSWELRAATSLARLWQSQGKREESCELLEPVYGWFTEGHDTADLIDAKALLDELT